MTDYIDRQAAIRWVKTECNPYGKPTLEFESGKKVIEHLEQMPSAEVEPVKHGRWVPVSERLPEEDTEVLISYRYKEGEGDTSHVDIDITTYGQMYFGGNKVGNNKHWRAPFEYFYSNYEVIAWMPLPEPYAEEGEEQ